MILQNTARVLITKLRNFLNEKYPVTHVLMGAQGARWDRLEERILDGTPIGSVGEVLEKLSLGYTHSVTGLRQDLDFSAASFPFIFEALAKLADASGQRIYLLNDKKNWVDLTNARFKSWIRRPSSSGAIEVAIVDQGGTLLSRYSIILWKQTAQHIEAFGDFSPVKKLQLTKHMKWKEARRTNFKVEPIDAVFTWVNSADVEWLRALSEFKDISTIDRDRFDQHDELKYSLRSVQAFAPWIRNIYIFSNCSPPTWFKGCDRIKWVMHEEVVPKEYLPTFNSHAIETFLHLIPNLSENFIYFNDDFFLTSPVRPVDFFTTHGLSVARLEPYGSLPYLQQLKEAEKAEEWQQAAVTGASLIYERFKALPLQAHRHAPYALSKSVFNLIASEFPEYLEQTRLARFRSFTDVSFASFFYHHFALARRRAYAISENSIIIRPSNYKRHETQRFHEKVRFFCLNDGGGSSHDRQYNEFKRNFLKKRFQFKSLAEL